MTQAFETRQIHAGQAPDPVTGSRAGILTWLARQDPSGVRAEALPELTPGL